MQSSGQVIIQVITDFVVHNNWVLRQQYWNLSENKTMRLFEWLKSHVIMHISFQIYNPL